MNPSTFDSAGIQMIPNRLTPYASQLLILAISCMRENDFGTFFSRLIACTDVSNIDGRELLQEFACTKTPGVLRNFSGNNFLQMDAEQMDTCGLSYYGKQSAKKLLGVLKNDPIIYSGHFLTHEDIISLARLEGSSTAPAVATATSTSTALATAISSSFSPSFPALASMVHNTGLVPALPIASVSASSVPPKEIKIEVIDLVDPENNQPSLDRSPEKISPPAADSHPDDCEFRNHEDDPSDDQPSLPEITAQPQVPDQQDNPPKEAEPVSMDTSEVKESPCATSLVPITPPATGHYDGYNDEDQNSDSSNRTWPQVTTTAAKRAKRIIEESDESGNDSGEDSGGEADGSYAEDLENYESETDDGKGVVPESANLEINLDGAHSHPGITESKKRRLRSPSLTADSSPVPQINSGASTSSSSSSSSSTATETGGSDVVTHKDKRRRAGSIVSNVSGVSEAITSTYSDLPHQLDIRASTTVDPPLELISIFDDDYIDRWKGFLALGTKQSKTALFCEVVKYCFFFARRDIQRNGKLHHCCPFCLTDKKTTTDLRDHIIKEHCGITDSLHCSDISGRKCSFKTWKVCNLNMHMTRTHNMEPVKSDDVYYYMPCGMAVPYACNYRKCSTFILSPSSTATSSASSNLPAFPAQSSGQPSLQVAAAATSLTTSLAILSCTPPAASPPLDQHTPIPKPGSGVTVTTEGFFPAHYIKKWGDLLALGTEEDKNTVYRRVLVYCFKMARDQLLLNGRWHFCCPFCSSDKGDVVLLRDHIIAEHCGITDSLQCSDLSGQACSFKTWTLSILNEHLVTSHSKEPLHPDEIYWFFKPSNSLPYSCTYSKCSTAEDCIVRLSGAWRPAGTFIDSTPKASLADRSSGLTSSPLNSTEEKRVRFSKVVENIPTASLECPTWRSSEIEN